MVFRSGASANPWGPLPPTNVDLWVGKTLIIGERCEYVMFLLTWDPQLKYWGGFSWVYHIFSDFDL
jgi:hypothetical protein